MGNLASRPWRKTWTPKTRKAKKRANRKEDPFHRPPQQFFHVLKTKTGNVKETAETETVEERKVVKENAVDGTAVVRRIARVSDTIITGIARIWTRIAGTLRLGGEITTGIAGIAKEIERIVKETVNTTVKNDPRKRRKGVNLRSILKLLKLMRSELN